MIDQLARDLTTAFPDMKGFSCRNLLYTPTALRGMTQPIGVAEYKLQVPDELARYLPSIDQIESGLQDAALPGGEDTPA